MSHQSQLEKPKYRNWVRGALAYKYLKEGIEGFADDFFQKEHARILGLVNNTSGTACNTCSLELLLQKRNCEKMCNIILVEIEKSFVSKASKDKPNWKNIEIKKLYTSPWEVAKCFIKGPGYSKTEKAADVDASGLLLLFIYNKNLQLSGNMTETGVNILKECRGRRDDLFHSPEMELEDDAMEKCIDDIKAILENHTELAITEKAKQNVSNLQQLKQQDFIITTHNEAEVHRDVLAFITRKEIEFKDMIQEATDEIYRKQDDAFKVIDDKLQTDLQDALAENSDIKYLKQSVEILFQIVDNIKGDMRQMKKHLEEIDKGIGELKAVKDLHMEKMKYIEQKQALQDGLVKLYQRHYVKTSLSPLKRQENDINIDEVYVEPNMMVVEADKQQSGDGNSRFETGKHEERSGAVDSRFETGKKGDKPVHGYHDLFHSNGRENKAIYIVGDFGTGKTSFCKRMIQDWCKAATSPKSVTREVSDKPRTCEITDDSNANRTSRIAEKSSASSSDLDMSDKKSLSSDEDEMRKFDFLFNIQLKKKTKHCKIIDMIQSICTEETLASTELVRRIFEQDSERCLIIIDGLDEWRLDNIDKMDERMSHESYGLLRKQEEETLASTELVRRIDKMDERMSHESYGLPRKQDIKNATVVTLSRPSALGMLNIKSSEMDQKVELKGIYLKTIPIFFRKYLSKLNKPEMASDDLMRKFEESELRHLENTPLLLQQLVWLFCNNSDFGKSVSDIYSHLVNIMFGWLKTKGEESKARDKGNQYVQMSSPLHQNSTEESKSCCSDKGKQFEKMKLPKLLDRFPRCKENKSLLIPLARVAFEFLTSKSEKGYLSRSDLESNGVSKDDVSKLIGLGILVEENCVDPTYEETQLSFIHLSYLEFFAAVYASCQLNEQQSDKNTSVLTELFKKVETVAGILQLSNFLRMICGLCPFVITEVSGFISDIVKRDEKLERQNVEKLFTDSSLHQIQKLILSFLSECDSTVTNDTMVYIADVLIYDSTEMSAIKSIIPENVISLSLKFWTIQSKIEKWMKQLKHLQYLNISFCKISHENMPMLCSVIQEAPLRCISWKGESCELQDCRDHSIDLSKHDHLQVIKVRISDCEKKKIKISNINTEHLETIHLNSTIYIDLLQNSGRLNELHLGLPYYSLQSYTLKYNKDIDTVVHTLHQLQTLTLSRAYIDENALTVTPEMRTLNHITLYNVEMSLETWRTFVDTLLTLQQSVQVDIRYKTEWVRGHKHVEEKRKYVEGKENMFEIIEDITIPYISASEKPFRFSFRTRKQ